jgi:hypothetical protein
MKSNKGQYNKGTSGNTQGRPAEPREALAKLKRFADKRSPTAYKHLSRAVEANEPWAIELVFKELLPDTDSLRLDIDFNNPDKVRAMIDAILSSLSEREYLTVSESCQVLNSLTYLRKVELENHLPKFN